MLKLRLSINIKDIESPIKSPNSLSINDSFINSAPYCDFSLKYNSLLDSVTIFILHTAQPLSTVDDEYFIKMISAFKFNYSRKIPNFEKSFKICAFRI